MPEQDPQIIDLDPDQAPRMTAIILLVCGLMGVGFLVVNLVFTGDDHYYDHDEDMQWIDPENQRFDITPNLVRQRQGEDSEEEEQVRNTPKLKPVKKPPSTSPFTNPFQPLVPTTQGLK